jgi:hypothetical protein
MEFYSFVLAVEAEVESDEDTSSNSIEGITASERLSFLQLSPQEEVEEQ